MSFVVGVFNPLRFLRVFVIAVGKELVGIYGFYN